MYQISGGTIAAACFCSALIGTTQPGDVSAIQASIPWVMGIVMLGGTMGHFARLKWKE